MRQWLPFAIICIFLAGCYQDKDFFILEGTTGNIDQFFSTVQTLEREFTFNVDNGTMIVTADNSILSIPADAFQDANGNVVSNTMVTLEYLLIKDKGLLVMYDKPTISDGRLLESGGVFYFEAYDASTGEQFELREGSSIEVMSVEENPIQGMQLFTGENADPTFNWEEVNDTWGAVQINEWSVLVDSMEVEGVGYEFVVDSMTWINCDVFNNIPDDEKTEVCVSLPEIYTNRNTAVFTIFNDINSVTTLVGEADTMMFCDPYAAIPIGYDVTFICISAMGPDLYHFGMKNAVISDNHVDQIVPEERTLEEILDILGMF